MGYGLRWARNNRLLISRSWVRAPPGSLLWHNALRNRSALFGLADSFFRVLTVCKISLQARGLSVRAVRRMLWAVVPGTEPPWNPHFTLWAV